MLAECSVPFEGKGAFRDEFVTAGGVCWNVQDVAGAIPEHFAESSHQIADRCHLASSGEGERWQVDVDTMESTVVSKLYFAGELLDVDGITGGYNFQSAWTTGWLAGTAIGRRANEKQ